MFKFLVPQKDGTFITNKLKSFVRPFFLTPDSPNQEMALAGGVGQQATQPISISQEGPFQALSLLMQSDNFTATGDHLCTVMITDAGSRRQLMNRPIHANTIFGTPEFPMVLSERLLLHEERSLVIRLQNLGVGANDVRPVLAGRRIYQSSANIGDLDEWVIKNLKRTEVTMPYFLTTQNEIEDLAHNTPTTFIFPSASDSFMEVFAITGIAYDVVAGTPTGTFDIIFRDAKTRREIESGPMSDALVVGTGLQPFRLPESWVIEPRQNIEIELTNTTASTEDIDVYLTLIGRKVYK